MNPQIFKQIPLSKGPYHRWWWRGSSGYDNAILNSENVILQDLTPNRSKISSKALPSWPTKTWRLGLWTLKQMRTRLELSDFGPEKTPERDGPDMRGQRFDLSPLGDD